MKVLRGIGWGVLLFGLAFLGARGQDEPPTEGTPREVALEHLLSERESPEALERAIARARELGISEQAILEARFLYFVDQRDDAAIASLVPEFLQRKETFKLEDSEIFATIDDWLAVTEYAQSIAALRKGDKDAFKKHITEAFWLSPKQGAAFAPHIDRIRLQDAMKDVRVDTEKEYRDNFSGAPVALGEVLGERRALLLHFWSPWSRECEATLPEFFASADYLDGKGIAVASMLPETSRKILDDAKAMVAELKRKPPGAWLVDVEKDALSHQLRIQSVPTMVLLSAEREVLFNGHPADEALWQALATIDPSIERPAIVPQER